MRNRGVSGGTFAILILVVLVVILAIFAFMPRNTETVSVDETAVTVPSAPVAAGREAINDIQEGVENAGDAAAARFPEVTDTVRDAATDARDAVAAGLPEVRQTGKTIAEDARDAAASAGSAIGKVLEKTGNAIEAGAEAVQNELSR